MAKNSDGFHSLSLPQFQVHILFLYFYESLCSLLNGSVKGNMSQILKKDNKNKVNKSRLANSKDSHIS